MPRAIALGTVQCPAVLLSNPGVFLQWGLTKPVVLHQTPPLRDLWTCNLSAKPLEGYTSLFRGEYPAYEQVRHLGRRLTAWLTQKVGAFMTL